MCARVTVHPSFHTNLVHWLQSSFLQRLLTLSEPPPPSSSFILFIIYVAKLAYDQSRTASLSIHPLTFLFHSFGLIALAESICFSIKDMTNMYS